MWTGIVVRPFRPHAGAARINARCATVACGHVQAGSPHHNLVISTVLGVLLVASAAMAAPTTRPIAADGGKPINFANQVVPIFTKTGCNSGGCHGKSGGQNGFALSLLGFVPEMDYAALVKEARGRRLFLAAPERSLLLLKASGGIAHAGGTRMETGSAEY